jgi:hypothetical protein
LRQLYEKHSVAKSEKYNLRRSTLQALALQSVDVYDPALRDWLERIARAHAENDPDACCFSTSELILSRLGVGTIEQWRQARRNKPESNNGVYGNVMIDAHGTAYSIIQYTDHNEQLAKFAIATTETTNRDFDKFTSAIEKNEPRQNPRHPFELQTKYDFRLVYYYCNWLSTENGLSDNMCYPKDISMEVIAETAADVLRTGYRLPTIQEWTVANKSLRVLEGSGANSNPFALNYAWVFDNAGGNAREVATRLPNAAGLFDSFGNIQEICQAKDGDLLEFFEIGQSARVKASALSIDKGKWHHEVINPDQNKKGIRLVRTMQ